ncbi:MAG: SRPBCC domain-containing protein [Thermomicrobiales bacterium]|nr:SRPBCC domain-containing protein [Thermomicrobiales bacterium]
MQGEMLITYVLAEAPDGGTDLHATHEHLPPGVSPEDNAAGWRMSLGTLARLAEGE